MCMISLGVRAFAGCACFEARSAAVSVLLNACLPTCLPAYLPTYYAGASSASFLACTNASDDITQTRINYVNMDLLACSWFD